MGSRGTAFILAALACGSLLSAVALALPGRDAAIPAEGDASYTWNASSQDVVFLEKWKYHTGDDTAWAAPAWPDGDWKLNSGALRTWIADGLPPKGIIWYRARIRLQDPIDSLEPLYLNAFHNPDAQEVFWDGLQVGSNGRVAADAAGEKPGRMFQSITIPWKLCGPGEHMLALRISNFRTFTGGMGYVKLGGLKPLQNAMHGQIALLVFLMGIFFITSIFHFANFMNRIQPTYGLFSLFCMGCTLQSIPMFAAIYLNVKMPTFIWADAATTLAWGIMMISLPMFFLSEFTRAARRWYWLLGTIVASIMLPLELAIVDLLPAGMFRGVSGANDILGFATILLSLGISAWAVWKKKPGSGSASLGLLCLLAGVALTQASRWQWAWAVGLTALILFLNGGLARRLTRQGMAFQESNLRSARLEIELLKKNIQPHFLLNSLRSITDWLEREPKVAARLVNSLASELRMVLKLSSERIIPLAEEIKLCRSHLEVMGLRGHRALSLETQGVDGEERIPPMVLHTLLEMGLEEAEEGPPAIRFLLAAHPGKGLRLRLSHQAPLKPRWQRASDETGLKYVRARLEEAFPGRWNLSVGAVPAAGNSWQADVNIQDPGSLPGPRAARGEDAVHPP